MTIKTKLIIINKKEYERIFVKIEVMGLKEELIKLIQDIENDKILKLIYDYILGVIKNRGRAI